jgi:two-component system sensor histidine kinase KdpD
MNARRGIDGASHDGGRRWRAIAGEGLFWAGVLALVTASLHPIRAELDKAHVAMVLLLVVLGAGARGGRVLGVSLGLASFIVFDWFFLPPYGTLRLANPLDWLVLVTFLVTSVVAAELLHRQREATRRAEAEALKDALIASVSHDLRTPLTTIKALAHELGALGDERSQVIEEQADRLNRYVADLLDLSRLNAGEMPLHVELNAVDDLLSALVQETEARVAGRALDVGISPAGTILTGRFDLALSARILANLVENAHKYSPPGVPIEVSATERGGRIEISVLDRGPGVPPEEGERIFMRFYRPPGSPPDAGSVGLGLAVGRLMAELQGGSLRHAPRDGVGSAFTLSLPAAGLYDTTGAERAARSFVKS